MPGSHPHNGKGSDRTAPEHRHAAGGGHLDAHTDTHPHQHSHEHGHAHDRGLAGATRYLRLLRHMWRSDVSAAVVARIAPRLGERVVDIGAGMGPAAVLAARCGATVIALDPTPFMRRVIGLRRWVQSARRCISVVDGAAESMPLADGSVDAAWTVNTIHHWTDLDRALSEIHRVLRPGGRVVLVDEDFDHPSHPAHARVQAGRAQHAHHFAVVDPVDIAARFARLGFAPITGGREQIAGRPCKVVHGLKR